MATIIDRAERPKTNDRPVSDKNLEGRYRVVHGDLIVPLPEEQRKEAVLRGDPPFESLYKGSLVDLTHEEADLLLEHGVIEPEQAPRRGQVAMANKQKATRA